MKCVSRTLSIILLNVDGQRTVATHYRRPHDQRKLSRPGRDGGKEKRREAMSLLLSKADFPGLSSPGTAKGSPHCRPSAPTVLSAWRIPRLLRRTASSSPEEARGEIRAAHMWRQLIHDDSSYFAFFAPVCESELILFHSQPLWLALQGGPNRSAKEEEVYHDDEDQKPDGPTRCSHDLYLIPPPNL